MNFIPNVFSNPATAANAIGPVLPGFSGSRNTITGPGFADFDADIHKTGSFFPGVRVNVYNFG